MTNDLFIKLFQRDLDKLKVEISLYTKKANIWVIDPEISNSAGNLCLHIVGNLNHFIGFALGKTGYERNRESEFSTKNIPTSKLIEEIEEVSKTISNTLAKLSDENLNEQYPIQKFEENATIEFLLVHLLCHLNYHLGQVNYHRRLFDI
ncbi:DinB family protein [Aequorivita antarctica]|uniref:DinB family protein n=1 Tax=Aequorivita antarctica TaxID=153266 RepID=A0A5C6Z1C6_9FLAO|nr:DinB family protein [Aequorivita antarctica]TXD73260.1 DinB family protein [Aequorivita antarctica]SRX76013.1 hypothetical protein AEQU3_03011 [Aequorivita antarctica]